MADLRGRRRRGPRSRIGSAVEPDCAEYPLPDDPLLAQVASGDLHQTGQWAWVVDDAWRLVFATHAVRYTYAGGTGALADFAIGHFLYGPESLALARGWRFGPTSTELMAVLLRELGGWMLGDLPGGADELRRIVDRQELRAVVDGRCRRATRTRSRSPAAA